MDEFDYDSDDFDIHLDDDQELGESSGSGRHVHVGSVVGESSGSVNIGYVDGHNTGGDGIGDSQTQSEADAAASDNDIDF